VVQDYHRRRLQTDFERSITSLSAPTRIGLVQPNSLMDAATCLTCSGVQQKLSDAQSAVARYEKAFNELRIEAQVESASLIPEAIRANQKRLELVGRIEGHRTALTSSSGNIPLDEFVAQVRAANLDLLPAELERIREEIEQLEDEKAKYTSERDAIDKEFQVREAAIALRTASCEKESAAARIEALTAEYIEQQLGSILLAKAMALYREKHQDPLLKRAGEYFATLDCIQSDF
jgi:uncharacterized protein YhaN